MASLPSVDRIHATAIIDSRAELDSSVTVGAYSVIGPDVQIGANTTINSHVVIEGHTSIGVGNIFHSFSVIGGPSQDKKYAGQPTRLEIGARNTVREFCTVNLGVVDDNGGTQIGSDNWIMAYVHIAHDCHVGSHTIFANNATLAGHVSVGDWVVLGGFSAVHQFCKIGPHAMLGMNTSLSQDVPPFVLLSGNPAAPFGINIEGLKRRGFTRDQITALRTAYKTIFKYGLTIDQAKVVLDEQATNTPDSAPQIILLRDFLSSTTRGIVR
jgi:UDP-N-acetylglucosamine acyltransferase